MWFQDFSKHEELIKPIMEVRPQIEAYYKSKPKERILLDPKFKDLHFGYSIKFDKISEATKLPAKPSSLRVLEFDNNGPIAFHVFDPNKKKPQLLESMISVKRINDFYEALEKIKEKVKDETKGEIRFLAVPSLNVQSVWIHFDEPGKDGFSLITRFDPKDEELMGEAKYKHYLFERKKRLESSGNKTGDIEGEKMGG